MKCGWLLTSALSAILLGGCATRTGVSGQPALADANAAPKVSVAADRCLESIRLRNSQHGAFFRELIC